MIVSAQTINYTFVL